MLLAISIANKTFCVQDVQVHLASTSGQFLMTLHHILQCVRAVLNDSSKWRPQVPFKCPSAAQVVHAMAARWKSQRATAQAKRRPRAAKFGPRGAQEQPSATQERPSTSQEAPKRRPRGVQETSKLAQEASKWAQEASKRPKRRPRGVQVGPRGVQVGPRGVQEASRARQASPAGEAERSLEQFATFRLARSPRPPAET